jgi:glycogen synthase
VPVDFEARTHFEARTLLLVRNGVDHDARVLRAARVAERALGGRALVVGVATAASPAGPTTVEGVPVVRLPARPPGLARLWEAPSRRLWRSAAAPPAAAASGVSTQTPSTDAARGRGASTASPAPTPVAGAPPTRPAGESRRPGASAALPRVTLFQRTRRWFGGLSYATQAVALARGVRPQLVHANDWNTMWAGLLVKWLYGARLVYDSHELWADRNGRWEWRPWLIACEALFVRAADGVVTASPGYAGALASRYRIAPPAVVRNIPESPPPSVPATRSGERGKPLVVYVGGLMPGRGLEQMIDALPQIPEARLCAVGPGAPPYRAGLLARARAAGVSDRVELRAPVAPGEIGEVLAGATAGLCLIQPICRSYELSLPNKLFEYAAAGVPVLASDLPIIGRLVRREEIGVLAPVEDSGAIAAGLRSLAEPERWRLTAQRARAFADTHRWPQEARTLECVYRGRRAP